MNDISAYLQVYSNQKAVFECLKSFKTFYKNTPITLVSDNGDDFSEISNFFKTQYVHADKNILPKGKMSGIDGVDEYLKRIYNHCLNNKTEWVVLLEEDVRTIRHIRSFPNTECAGPRLNPYSVALTNHLKELHGIKEYGYGMCGGSIFKRKSFIDAYENNNNIKNYLKYDERLAGWGDIPLTLIFHINGYNYSIWEEVSEILHPSMPLIKDSAFDHAYKYWYNKLLDKKEFKNYE